MSKPVETQFTPFRDIEVGTYVRLYLNDNPKERRYQEGVVFSPWLGCKAIKVTKTSAGWILPQPVGEIIYAFPLDKVQIIH